MSDNTNTDDAELTTGILNDQDGVQENSPFVVDGLGLIIKREPTYDEWENAGKEINRAFRMADNARGRLRWMYGDWVVYGEEKFPEKWSQAVDFSMYSAGTLRNAIYVCKSIPRERRVDTLGMEHHYEVARLDPDDQQRFLLMAAEQAMTIMELRRAVQLEYPITRQMGRRKTVFDAWFSRNKYALAEMKTDYEAYKTVWVAAGGLA